MKKKDKNYGVNNKLNLGVVIGLYRSYLRLNRSTQKLIASYNITISQFGVLEALYHLGPMKIGDIIEKILSTSGNMTVVIKNLEKEGLISRCFDLADKRVCLIQLTEEGEKLIETVFPEHLQELEKVLSNLDELEKKELVRLFKKLNGL